MNLIFVRGPDDSPRHVIEKLRTARFLRMMNLSSNDMLGRDFGGQLPLRSPPSRFTIQVPAVDLNTPDGGARTEFHPSLS